MWLLFWMLQWILTDNPSFPKLANRCSSYKIVIISVANYDSAVTVYCWGVCTGERRQSQCVSRPLINIQSRASIRNQPNVLLIKSHICFVWLPTYSISMYYECILNKAQLWMRFFKGLVFCLLCLNWTSRCYGAKVAWLPSKALAIHHRTTPNCTNTFWGVSWRAF